LQSLFKARADIFN